MIIGWSLINSCIENPVLQFSKDKVEEFKSANLIPINSKVGLALQWCIDKEFQGIGLIQSIYSYFEILVSQKYDMIEASVRKNNPAGNAATSKLGMQLIYEDDLRYYKIKSTNKLTLDKGNEREIIFSDKKIAIRLGKEGDETGLYELNKKWIIKDNEDKSNGFLTSLYEKEHFAKIIKQQEIVVATLS